MITSKTSFLLAAAIFFCSSVALAQLDLSASGSASLEDGLSGDSDLKVDKQKRERRKAKRKMIFGDHGVYFHLEEYYAYMSDRDDLFVTRLAAGYKLPIGFKFGAEGSFGYFDAHSVCFAPATDAECDACFDRGDDRAAFFGFGPMVGLDLMVSGRTGFEFRAHLTWPMYGEVDGRATHGGVSLFTQIDRSAPVFFRLGVDVGRWNYTVRDVDIASTTVVPSAGLGWQL
jgi:hypothetical protein